MSNNSNSYVNATNSSQMVGKTVTYSAYPKLVPGAGGGGGVLLSSGGTGGSGSHSHSGSSIYWNTQPMEFEHTLISSHELLQQEYNDFFKFLKYKGIFTDEEFKEYQTSLRVMEKLTEE